MTLGYSSLILNARPITGFFTLIETSQAVMAQILTAFLSCVYRDKRPPFSRSCSKDPWISLLILGVWWRISHYFCWCWDGESNLRPQSELPGCLVHLYHVYGECVRHPATCEVNFLIPRLLDVSAGGAYLWFTSFLINPWKITFHFLRLDIWTLIGSMRNCMVQWN